jgi:uncharacterized membrane protein YjjP (DUF1212 family)
MTDPRLFNFVIMALYFGAMIWWAWNGKWTDAAYWFFALGITATVTFGYSR